YASELADREHNAIFVTHDAYGYLARRYGLHQHTIIGIHVDEEPGVATIARIADEMAEHGIHTFFVQPLYPDTYAETIKIEVQRITGETVTILTLYHMSNTVEDMDYFQQMEANLVNLKVGLGA
ncbi:MAG: zinc ABC transporter substrate-binding protein, partial [Candidatus Thermoplasmatota archaeon]|nr:zinc ABC transporter substrate-binding protein [Candidatus Thermoplasmatota archaeon]